MDEECKNNDGRGKYEWQTRYGDQAVKEITIEGIYLVFILLLSLVLIFLNWMGCFCTCLGLAQPQSVILKKIIYYLSSGLLGGVTFGIKFFYHAVGTGDWHQDRRAWRIMSPLLSSVVAVIIGLMIDAGLMNGSKNSTSCWIIAIGFFAGYFADKAIGKMREIASVLFGNSNEKKKDNDCEGQK